MFLTRAATHLVVALVLVAAGVMQHPVGVVLVVTELGVSLWALGQAARSPFPTVAWGVVDVIFPPMLGILVGHNPYSLHLLVGAQVAAAFLSPRPHYARVVGIAAGLAVILGLVFDAVPSPIELSDSGYLIAETGAVIVGLVLSGAMITLLGYRNWQTNRKLAAAAEAERSASETQRRFMSMVSHELRTPLTSIQGFSELLSDRSEFSDDELDEFNDAVRQQASHLARLVDDVLVVLRVDAGRLEVKPQPVSLDEMMQRIELSVAVRPSKRLVMRTDDHLEVEADPDRLFQVLRNLVENADKYGGDRIVLEAARCEEGVRIIVSDNGEGIPAEMAESAFDEFVQHHSASASVESGFGLGLSIVRSLIEAMGGVVRYEPAADHDPRFVIGLPAAGEEYGLEVVETAEGEPCQTGITAGSSPE